MKKESRKMNKVLVIRIEMDVYENLKIQADKEERTIATILRKAIREYLKFSVDIQHEK